MYRPVQICIPLYLGRDRLIERPRDRAYCCHFVIREIWVFIVPNVLFYSLLAFPQRRNRLT